MRCMSLISGFAGIALAALAVIGRFRGDPELWIRDVAYPAGKVILLANTLLLIGIFLALACRPKT